MRNNFSVRKPEEAGLESDRIQIRNKSVRIFKPSDGYPNKSGWKKTFKVRDDWLLSWVKEKSDMNLSRLNISVREQHANLKKKMVCMIFGDGRS